MSTRTVYCQNCGEMIPEDAAFCPYCGTPNDAAGTQQPELNPEPEFTVPDPIPENGFLPSDGPKEPKKNWILILAVVIIMPAQLKRTQTPPPAGRRPVPAKAGNTNTVLFIVIIVLLVLILLVAIGAYAYLSGWINLPFLDAAAG